MSFIALAWNTWKKQLCIRNQSGECRGLRSSSGESPRAEQQRGILTEIFGSCSPLAATAPWKVTEDCPSCCSQWQGEGVSIRNDSGTVGRLWDCWTPSRAYVELAILAPSERGACRYLLWSVPCRLQKSNSRYGLFPCGLSLLSKMLFS